MAGPWNPALLLSLPLLIGVILILRRKGFDPQSRERRVLQRKYGDIPMFADFFRRLDAEESNPKKGST